MTEWWYLSFAGGGFRGACLVRATSPADAVREAHALKINPGGEVLAAPLSKLNVPLPPPEFRERLLSREEVYTCWPDSKTAGELADDAARRSGQN